MDFEDKSLVLVVIQFWRNLSQFTFPDVQQSDSIMHIYIYIYSSFTLPSIVGYYEILSIVPCTVQ